jgi:isopropylmalate/homocitrate/citramalate synthase
MADKKSPWIQEMWSVSPFNFARGAIDDLPKRVHIHDTTLRDGISDPARGIFLNTSERIKIAQALDDLGLKRIEIGLTTESDLNDLKAITGAGLKAKTFLMTPTVSFGWSDAVTKKGEWKAVDIALKADVSGLVVNFPASEYLIKHYFPTWSSETMLEKAVSMVAYAKKHGLFVNLFEYDTTRADPMYLKKLLKAAVGAKADTVSIVDTLGVGSPAGIQHLVKLIRNWVKVPVELHMHDDFGLAYANTLAGVEAGAEVAQTTINGIGKMAATEDVITSLRILYGLDTGVKYDRLYGVSKSAREIGRWTISPYRPISGELAFGYDTDGRIDENRSQRAPFLPEFIGHRYRILVNKRTGPKGIASRVEELGRTATDAQIERIMAELAKTWEKTGQNVNDQEFEAAVKRVLG